MEFGSCSCGSQGVERSLLPMMRVLFSKSLDVASNRISNPIASPSSTLHRDIDCDQKVSIDVEKWFHVCGKIVEKMLH